MNPQDRNNTPHHNQHSSEYNKEYPNYNYENSNYNLDDANDLDKAELEGAGERSGNKEKKSFKRQQLIKGVAIVGAILFAFYVCPVPLGSLKVTGSNKVTVEDVEVAGNISQPINVLKISTEKFKSRLANDLRVEEATVSYEFPLTMVVNIKERKAIAVIPAQFGYLTLDKKGQVIASEPAISNTSVPIISGVKPGNILLGDTVKDPAILGALTYLNALSADGFKGIAEVNVGDASDILAYTINGLQVKLGNTADLAKKAELSETMIQDVETRKVNAQYLDVNLTSPYIKTR